MVLIEARGHTPGSQMIYIARADGAEVILTGDTAWLMDNIATEQAPAKLATFIIGSDRAQNACQLAALHRITESEPDVSIMSGHDAAHMRALVSKGVFTPQFQ